MCLWQVLQISIDGVSSPMQPLIQLTQKDAPFIWTPTTHYDFDALKATFLSAPMLVHPNPTWPFQVETNASDFAIGARSCPNLTTMAPYIRSPSTPGSLQVQKSIIRSTTRSLQLSSRPSPNGDPIWLGPNIVFRCWPTTRISFTSPPRVRWIGGRLVGHLF